MYHLPLHAQVILILSSLDFMLGLKVLFFFVSLQLRGFPWILCRFYKAVTERLLGWVTRGDSFNLPTVLGMFILNVFPISTLCVRTDPWALITQKSLHLTFSQTPLQAYVLPKCQVWNCHYTNSLWNFNLLCRMGNRNRPINLSREQGKF